MRIETPTSYRSQGDVPLKSMPASTVTPVPAQYINEKEKAELPVESTSSFIEKPAEGDGGTVPRQTQYRAELPG